ncbi:GtrA family protein [Terriglobus sp. TAA 43]|uniref:GtrA family protein n=1 Tax=Terriglobus sp. TAA 43 TaxID=278961 RepID=UPI0006462F7E|nr:GtrA family protein [Terriglobus sp. TAA 43]
MKARITSIFQSGEFVRFLLVGVCNTLFGYVCYAAFVAVYKHFLPQHMLYLTVDLASITATPLGVTFSFLTYKFFVFKTKGNYLREWLRCLMVYGAASLPNLILLPLVTKLLMTVQAARGVAPYLAGAIVMGGVALFTYVAHKKFSFVPGKPTQPLEPTGALS